VVTNLHDGSQPGTSGRSTRSIVRALAISTTRIHSGHRSEWQPSVSIAEPGPGASFVLQPSSVKNSWNRSVLTPPGLDWHGIDPWFARLSSGCFIAEEDILLSQSHGPTPPWRACPNYLQVAPVGLARRVGATARFRWPRDARSSARHLRVTAGKPFSCPRCVRSSGHRIPFDVPADNGRQSEV
jgi:hypothetical protein